MKKRSEHVELDNQLNAYAATVRTSSQANALKHCAEKWSVYAAAAGAAVAMASNASASIIYSGAINTTVNVASGQRGLDGGHVSYNKKDISFGNPAGANFSAGILFPISTVSRGTVST